MGESVHSSFQGSYRGVYRVRGEFSSQISADGHITMGSHEMTHLELNRKSADSLERVVTARPADRRVETLRNKHASSTQTLHPNSCIQSSPIVELLSKILVTRELEARIRLLFYSPYFSSRAWVMAIPTSGMILRRIGETRDARK